MAINFSYETIFRRKTGYKLIAGLDEVGRGPLAGPVTAAAFVFLKPIPCRRLKSLLLRDSKLLNTSQREKLYNFFHSLKEEGRVDFASASVFPTTIDKRHIHHAVALAMHRAAQKLNIKPDYAIIDKFSYPGLLVKNIPYTLVPKADNLVPSVAAASIVAKVRRDATMIRYHKQYPQYGFDRHKGYGTRLHYQMLAKYGESPIHRKSFRLS